MIGNDLDSAGNRWRHGQGMFEILVYMQNFTFSFITLDNFRSGANNCPVFTVGRVLFMREKPAVNVPVLHVAGFADTSFEIKVLSVILVVKQS